MQVIRPNSDNAYWKLVIRTSDPDLCLYQFQDIQSGFLDQ